MKRFLKILDALLGITEPSIEDRVTKLLMGVMLPLLPVFYGLSSIRSGHSWFIGRHGGMHLFGRAATAAGFMYLSLGLLIHVHYCWKDHPKLAGVADFGQLILLLAIGLSLVMMIVGALA